MQAPPPPDDVLQRKDKKKKHKKRPNDEGIQLELIEEPVDRSEKEQAAPQAEKKEVVPAPTTTAAPTAATQLPVEPVSSKPKDKARNREQLKNSTMIVEEMEEGESFLRDYASDEVLLHIFTYMDPRTLGRCAQVCKRWHNVSEDRLLWIRHNRKEWLKSKDQSGAAAGKIFFLQRMNSFRRKKTAAEANRQRILRDAQARERRRRDGVLHAMILHTSYIDAIMMVCLVLFLAFVSIKLDKLVLWHWHTVGIPLFIFVLFLVIRLVHIIFFAEEMNDANPDSDIFSMGSKFFVRLVESHLDWVDTIVILLLLGALVTHVVLMFLFLDNIGGLTLAEVFAPVWIGYFCSIAFIFGELAQGDYLIGILSGLLPWMLYFMMIALKIDRVIFVNWATVHAPLWAGIPAWLIGIWVWMMFIDQFSSAAEGLFWVGLFSYIAVGIPVFLVFQIIMTVKLDKGTLWAAKWRALFSPLFIFFGIIACAAVSWAACVSTQAIDLIC